MTLLTLGGWRSVVYGAGATKPEMSALNRQCILDALQERSRRLAEHRTQAELCLFGGAAMILAFQSRQTTKDIDAIFVPSSTVHQLAEEIGRERGYEAGWFNDGVKGFVSDRGQHTAANLPQFPHLRIMMPVPAYLLAMKCLVARAGTGEATDV